MRNQQPLVWMSVLLLGSLAASTAGQEPVYLSDPKADLIVTVRQGWGELGWNTAVKPLDRPATPMKIKDRDYQHGLGHHAPGEILVDLGGKYKTFEADLGIQWQGGKNAASVVFEIYVDDQRRYQSRVVRESDPPEHVSVPVEGAEVLRLVATDAGDGITCDCANWADARLIPDPAPSARRAAEPFMDMAAFARVVSSDPATMKGTRAKRTEEFPAEDVFLSEEIPAGADGSYVLAPAAGPRCIGLEWIENRELRDVGLTFAEGSVPANLDAVELQFWAGESPWQGEWKRLAAAPQRDGTTATWHLAFRDVANGTPKIRWLFPPSDKPVAIAGFQAITRSRRSTVTLVLQCDPPKAGKPCEVEVYNGALLGSSSTDTPHTCTWHTGKPLELTVVSSVARPYKADRTVLRLKSPEAALAVAVEDVESNGAVYVPEAGLYITLASGGMAFGEYRQKFSGRKTVLAEVHSRPDQTFEQAMASVHNPIQDLGPMMFSLACDNRKFVAEREGTVVFEAYGQPEEGPIDFPKRYRLAPQFGTGPTTDFVRCLEGGWLPIPLLTMQSQGLHYRQRSFVAPVDSDPPADAPAWLRERAACVVEYEIENKTGENAEAKLELTLTDKGQPAAWQATSGRYYVADGDRLIALADPSTVGPLKVAGEGGVLRLNGTLPGKAQARLVVWIPAWKVDVAASATPIDAAALRAATETYWKGLLASAMQVDIPDAFLANVLRASQVHCLLAARNEGRGSRVSPWIGSDRYGPLESEANSIIHGMGLWGHTDFSRRGLEFFLKRYNQAGYLTTGYTLVGTGWNLWTLAEHFDLTSDRAWLEQAAPTVARACQWIVRQRAKTRRLDSRGEKMPGYGLMPPGVSADWNRYAFRCFNDAHYCAGLTAAARALAAIDYPGAGELVRDAEQYRQDLLDAFRWTQARMPVVKLQDGTWTPNHPGIVGFFGNVEEFTPGEDWNRSWAGSVEIGSSYLAALGILDPRGPETTAMVQYLEDHQFLRSGMGDYPEEASHKDPFNLGGFAKVQPYYGRTPEIWAQRDDVKAFIRAYFNAIPSLVSRENLSFWEHFHNRGGWNKTHETGWFLAQSRLVFVQEQGNDLRLAPFVTTAWLRDGMRVKVERAPTRFGEVSYEIRSSVGQGSIAATVTPPTQSPPESIVLRLRHPEGKKIARVLVNDQPYERFDSERETITLPASDKVIVVKAEY